jgi:twitching motility protein PilT
VAPELQQMLEEAAKRGASDLHLVPGEPPVYRVREKLVRGERDPLSEEEILQIVHAAIGAEQASRIGAELEVVVATCSLAGVVEGRMCITRHLDKLTVEVRLLPSGVPDPVAGRVPKALLDATDSPRGLILVTGLTGSGKNTVALMLLEHINANRAVHIVTIEDPVAVHMAPKQALIRQQSVGTDTPSFHGALRAVLRLDPDVIYVSDIRDVVTLQACVMAVQTGHLVIGVVHGPSPEGLIRLMIDLQPEEMRSMFRRSLAETLRAVAMSCLLPAASGHGRLAAYAVLVPDEALRQAITEGRDITTISPLPPGSQTLAEDIQQLVAEGKVAEQAAREALERVKQG